MDKSTLRILDTISSNLGYSMSINQLTERIKDMYGTAYYANIYQKLKELKKEDIVTLEQIGKSSSIKLCFQNYLLPYVLCEMEIEKTTKFLKNKNNLLLLLSEMEKKLGNFCALESAIAVEPDRNLKLNRLEIFFLLTQTPDRHSETLALSGEVQQLQNKHNLRIDSLILDRTQFQTLAASDEVNPVREIFASRIVLFGSEAFWRQIRSIELKMGIKTLHEKITPANISKTDLAFNLERFGYREFGRPYEVGKRICIEYIATALLLQDDVRLREAASVILAKNNFDGNLLGFLSRKFGTAGDLLGILKILRELKPSEEIKRTIDLLSVFNTQETLADQQSIEAKLRLYNVL